MFFADGKVYYTSETNRVVARLDPATYLTDWLLGTGQAGTHMVWVTRDATRMYTCNIGSNSISILERGANPNAAWNVTSIPVGRGPEGFDVSPDGRELWAAHSQDGGVSIIGDNYIAVIDLKSLSMAGKIVTGGGPDGMAWAR